MYCGNKFHKTTERYCTVRQNLDDLGFKQAFSLDTLPLIELLLFDLAQTKESLEHYRSLCSSKKQQTCSELQPGVELYKCDNAKLVQECNQAHLDLIKAKEENLRHSYESKKRIKKLESELCNLQKSFSRSLHRIRYLESESSNKSRKISELLEKCKKTNFSNNYFGISQCHCKSMKKPCLEAESYSKQSTSYTSSSVVEFENMGDQRINNLNNELTKLKEDLFLSNECVEMLKSEIHIKEKEMSRLRKMLEGGRPCSAISKDHLACQGNLQKSKSIEKFKSSEEIKFLQKEKQNLEQQLKEAMCMHHDAMKQAMQLAERNEELEKQLKAKDQFVQIDCNSAEKEKDRNVCKMQEKLECVMSQVHILESELTVQRREAQELRADLEACKLEKCTVQRALESTLEEKKRITDKINNMTATPSKCSEKIAREAKTFRQASSPSCRRSCSPKACACRNQITEEQTSKTDKTLREKNIIIDSLQCTIQKLEAERDKYKEENQRMKHEVHKNSDDYNKNELWSQICEQRAQMSEKEHIILKLMREKKELCQEKFCLENKLQSLQSQQRSSSQNTCACGGSSNSDDRRTLSCLHKKIEKLEDERNSARSDIEKLCEERDALRERLKLATATHVSEQCRLRACLTDCESRLYRVEQERNELLSKQGSRRATLNCLDEQVEELNSQLTRCREELSEQRTQYHQLRTLQDQTDQTLSDVQGQLTQCEIELSNALERNRNLECQQLQSDNQMRELKQEINTHRSRIAQLDREKDQLLADLDEKTEKIAVLERELCFKEQKLNDMEHHAQDMQHSKQQASDQALDLERQVRSMQLDMDNLQRQLSSACMERETAIHDNGRLQDELAALSCEVRSMHKDVEIAKNESRDLKRQLQTYVSEVRRAEDLLNQKENERTDMLNHFRSLSMEASVLESNNHSLENEAAEARTALQSARDQVTDLERQLSDKECLMRGYEDQINELTQTVASLEIQLQQALDERERAEDDLRTVREVCMSLETQKERLTKELDEALEQKSQYEIQIARYRSEQDIFQDQMNKDHKTIDRLERMLEEARRETMNSQCNSREMQTEVSKLKQKISDLQSKLCNESSELRKYQSQAAEYSKQINELRRKVTNQRFDKAKKKDDNSSKCTVAWKDQNDKNELYRQKNLLKPTWTSYEQRKSKNNLPMKSCLSKINVCRAQQTDSGAETSLSEGYNLRPAHHRPEKYTEDCISQIKNFYQRSRPNGQFSSRVEGNEGLQVYKNQDITCKERRRKNDCHRIETSEMELIEAEKCEFQKKSCKERRLQGNCPCARTNEKVDYYYENYENLRKAQKEQERRVSCPQTSCPGIEIENVEAELGEKFEIQGKSHRKSRQSWKKTDCAEEESATLAADTLQIMNRLIENKRKSRTRCSNYSDTSSCKGEKIDIREKIDPNCEVSTQTAEKNMRDPHILARDLVNILEDIQRYAQSVQEYFIENIPPKGSTSETQTNLEKNSEMNPAEEVREEVIQESQVLGKKTNDQRDSAEVPRVSPNQLPDQSLPDEHLSNLTLPEREVQDVHLSEKPAASTPRDSQREISDPPVSPVSKGSNTFSSASLSSISSCSIDSLICEISDVEKNPAMNELDSSNFKELPLRQFQNTHDSTKYPDLPKKIIAGPSRRIKHQLNEVYADVETVQEKIARLRKELLMDNEENSKNNSEE